MEWDRAKNYTIIFLLLLNLLLLGFNFMKRYETTLSAARIENITQLMKKKDITIGCSLPNRFVPMGRIGIKSYDYDYIVLQSIFMKNKSDIVRTQEFNRVIFKSDGEQLYIDGDTVSFSGTAEKPADINAALVIADRYVNDINNAFGSYKYDSIARTLGGYRAAYYEEVSGYNIFSNYVSVFISTEGNINIEVSYHTLTETGGEKLSVIAADEAVFALSDTLDEGITIDKVSIGYIMSDNTAAQTSAVPVYCIRADDKLYYVNGVSGNVMKIS